jgi:SPP1 family predicted phage head-tail adaptor
VIPRMKPTNPGTYRHRAIIRSKPADVMTTRGAQPGDPSKALAKAICWGQLVALQGREFEAAHQRWALATMVFETPYFNGALPTDRLECGGRVFQILGVDDPDGQRMRLMIYLQEVR